MPPRQTVIRPSGIVTQPNEYSEIPPGTLSVGDNIQLCRQGVLEPRNAFKYVLPLDPLYYQAVKIYPILSSLEDTQALVVARDPIAGGPGRLFHSFDFGGIVSGCSPIQFPTRTFVECSPGKTHFSYTRGRTIVTNDGVPVIADDPNGLSYRQAGLPPPFIVDVKVVPGTNPVGGCSYKAVFRRESPEGYVTWGPDSPAFTVSGAGVAALEVRVTWSADVHVPAGTFIEFYRTLPIEGESEVFRLAFDHKITFAEESARAVDLVDRTPNTALADFLYTNSGQEGAEKTNLMPPLSNDVCTFKGATFYVSRASTHQFVTRIPNGWSTRQMDPLTTPDMIGGRNYHGSISFTAGSRSFTMADVNGGLAPGQRISHYNLTVPPAIPEGAVVESVVGATVTMSLPALVTGTYTETLFTDVLYIDGVPIGMASPQEFVAELGSAIIGGQVRTLVYGDPALGQVYSENPTLTFTQFDAGAEGFHLTATNGQNYSPPLDPPGTPSGGATSKSTDDPRTNLIVFSKIEQPEAVPPSNFFYVGSGKILKMWATQELLFIFCTDGVFIVDGDGDDWQKKPFDPDTVLLCPDAVSSLNNEIYALTNHGFVSVTDSGVEKISALLITEDMRSLWAKFETTSITPPLPYTWSAHIACDKHRNEVWINFNDYEGDGYYKTWIWNPISNTFVTQSWVEPSTVGYLPCVRSIVVGTPNQLLDYDLEKWMATNVEFNSVFADDLGMLKQWIDTTLFFEDMTRSRQFLPRFDGVPYPDSYVLPTQLGSFEHVVAPTLVACHSKHMRFGFRTEGDGESLPTYYRLKGLSYRYRLASDTLRP